MRVSDATRSDTWEMLLDLERQVRYYLKLADRYMLWHRAFRIILLAGIIGQGTAAYFLAAGAPHSCGPCWEPSHSDWQP